MSGGTKIGECTGPIPCHACKGTFALGYEKRGDRDRAPIATHSLPYCAAFERIETVIDAVEFSRLCRNRRLS